MVSVFADLLYQPPLPALLEMARATCRVRLGAACLNPYTVVDRDGAAARRRARTEVARYLAVVAELDPTTELPAGFADQVRGLVAAGHDEAAGALIPDEVLDRFAFSGTPEHVATLAQRVLDAGVGRVDFGTPHGLADHEGVALLGAAVLPLLRRLRRVGYPL